MNFLRQTRFLNIWLIAAAVIATCVSVSTTAATTDDLYYEGQQALDDGNWRTAQQKFIELLEQVDQGALKQDSRRVESTLYWLAYAQNKEGDRAASVETLNRLIRDYPHSAWVDEAKQLSDEIQGKSMASSIADNDELQLAAINGLINAPAERVVPILKDIIFGDRPHNLKERALFVLSQKKSAQANDIMAQVIADDTQPELQGRAIKMMALGGGKQAWEVLVSLYKEADKRDTRESIIKAFGPAGAVEELATIIETEADPDLVETAIKAIGISGAKARPILTALYQSSAANESKRGAVVKSLGIAGGHREIGELLEGMDNKASPEAVKELIKTFGIFGGSKTALVSFYNRYDNAEIKEEIINAVFIQDNAAGLIDILKTETDPALRREAVKKLSYMNSKEATDYLINIIQQ